MTETPVIKLRHVSFSYQAVPVLEDVDLAIFDRESICIVGPNGGGKTTLLRLLLGQLRPTQGEIRIFGKPPEQARLMLGYMPQRSEYDSMFPVTVMDVVLMGRLGRPGIRGWLGWYGRKDRAAAMEALEQVHLQDAAPRTFAALSGGQRQRVLIARALCCEPELLLLDEPTANVDSLVEERLFDELRELGKRMTIVLVSHDLGFVTSLVQRVICVNRQAVAHPVSKLSADLIRDIYGGDVSVVRHGDVTCHREHVHG